MVRGGDFLVRRGMAGPAAIAAKDAIARGRGLISAYVVGFMCAQAQRDLSDSMGLPAPGFDVRIVGHASSG
jgi:hypothetical protein